MHTNEKVTNYYFVGNMPHIRWNNMISGLTIYGSYFGRNDDIKNSFWNLLTFSRLGSKTFVEYLWKIDRFLFHLAPLSIYVLFDF